MQVQLYVNGLYTMYTVMSSVGYATHHAILRRHEASVLIFAHGSGPIYTKITMLCYVHVFLSDTELLSRRNRRIVRLVTKIITIT